MITERINIDVRPGGVPVVIHVTQYEAGLRQFVFTPYTSAGELTVVAGSATLEGTKPDGYAFQQACEMIDGVITYTLQEQLCAVEGRVWSRLVIRDTNGGMIGYTAIVWVVGRAGVADDAVMSDSDISALRQFLDEFGDIDAYRGALNGALAAVGGPLVAATASAMTDTTKVYVYTGSESGYTEGHWYYWSGSAWTDGGVYQSTGINTDKTLTVEDMAADAKVIGDAVTELKNDLTEIDSASFEQGGFALANGILTNSNNICRTNRFRLNAGMAMTITTDTMGYNFAIYKTDGTYSPYKTAWSYSTSPVSFSFDYDCDIIVAVRASDDSVITPQDVSAIVSYESALPIQNKLYIESMQEEYPQMINQKSNAATVNGETFPSANGLTFSGNTTQDDPLVVTINNIYFMRNTSGSGAGYANRTGGTFIVPHGSALMFDYTSRTLSVESTGSYISTTKVCLFVKFGIIISGAWKIYYEEYKNSIVKNDLNNLSIIVDGFSESIDDIIAADGLKTQYLDNTAWSEGYYQKAGNSIAIVSVQEGSPWHIQKVSNLHAGTYYYNKFCSPNYTFFVDKTTGDITKASDLGIVQGVAGNITFANDFDAYITIYDSTTMPMLSAMFADGELPSNYIYGLYKPESSSSYVTPQGQTIRVVGTGDGNYPTIQAACDAATDGDIIFIRCGTYEEQVSIWTRKLHLIGEDKLNTVLIDHSGNYDTPPLEMAMGTLSNLTIIEDGANPDLDPSDSHYMMAYCLHIEHPLAAGETFEIDNCNFINEIHVPLGCGLRANNTVRFRNCRFYCGATDEAITKERGAFFVHSVNAADADNQWIIAENCTMESKGQRLAAMFGVPSGANNTGHMYIRLSNCNLWNENRGTADNAVTWDTTGGADVMELSHSYGNTIAILNSN